MNANRKTRALLAIAGAAVLPLGLTSVAHASTTQDGCTVTPSAPYFAGTYTTGNVPEVFYPYEVTCDPSSANQKVIVTTKTWESDRFGVAGDVDADGINNADDEYIGRATKTTKFSAAGGTKNVKIKGVLPHTDTDSNEEVYGAVQFQVKTGNVTGSLTAFELTQATQIWW